MNKELKAGDVVKVNTHRFGASTGNYGSFNVDKITPSQIHVYDHNTKEVMKFLKNSKRGIGAHSHMMLEEVELEEAKISTAQMSHQGKTTIKHIDNPGVELRMAAHDIKPGFAGYRDRVALLKAAQAQGKLKEEVETVMEGSFADSLKDRARTLVKNLSRSKQKSDDFIKDKEYNELSAHVNNIHPGFKLHSVGRNTDGQSLNWAAAHKDDKDFINSKSGVFKKQVTEEVESLDEAHKLKDEVIMSYPSLKGVKGRIGEIRHGAYKGAPKTYTIDYQHPKYPDPEGNMSSIQLSSDQFKAHKPGKLGEEVEELDEASFAGTMKKAINAHKLGHKKLAKYHLDNAKTARYALSSTEISKHKDLLDKYAELRKLHEEVESLDELSMDTVKSYKEKVSKNPAPSKTTSDILHKAIRRFAGKERAEDRIHHDEMVKMRARLGIKEETLDEDLVDSVKRGIKSVKRGMQGWDKNAVGPNGEKLGEPKAVVNRVKARTDDELKSIKDTFTDPKNTFVTRNTSFDNPTKHSPAGLQKRVLDREMKKRGLTSEETLDEVVKTEKPGHKVGDTVYATSPTNKALTMTGKVTKIGATLTTVKHKDGSEAHYPHKLVGKEYSDLHTDPAKKYKQFQREHLEQTGELLTLSEVKYMVENANGGAGAIAQHGGVDGQAPANTGKVRKMMGNKASVDAIVKIIAKGAKPN